MGGDYRDTVRSTASEDLENLRKHGTTAAARAKLFSGKTATKRDDIDIGDEARGRLATIRGKKMSAVPEHAEPELTIDSLDTISSSYNPVEEDVKNIRDSPSKLRRLTMLSRVSKKATRYSPRISPTKQVPKLGSESIFTPFKRSSPEPATNTDVTQETNNDVTQETNKDVTQETNKDVTQETNKDVIQETNTDVTQETNKSSKKRGSKSNRRRTSKTTGKSPRKSSPALPSQPITPEPPQLSEITHLNQEKENTKPIEKPEESMEDLIRKSNESEEVPSIVTSSDSTDNAGQSVKTMKIYRRKQKKPAEEPAEKPAEEPAEKPVEEPERQKTPLDDDDTVYSVCGPNGTCSRGTLAKIFKNLGYYIGLSGGSTRKSQRRNARKTQRKQRRRQTRRRQ
jgi:hypothetical protein